MKGEIDEDFYCSAGYFDTKGTAEKSGYCKYMNTHCKTGHCPNHHRKHPTPEQYREEYGEEYPDDWAVYVFYKSYDDPNKCFWMSTDYKNAARILEITNRNTRDFPIICACTQFGKPDDDWRLE